MKECYFYRADIGYIPIFVIVSWFLSVLASRSMLNRSRWCLLPLLLRPLSLPILSSRLHHPQDFHPDRSKEKAMELKRPSIVSKLWLWKCSKRSFFSEVRNFVTTPIRKPKLPSGPPPPLPEKPGKIKESKADDSSSEGSQSHFGTLRSKTFFTPKNKVLFGYNLWKYVMTSNNRFSINYIFVQPLPPTPSEQWESCYLPNHIL